LKAVRVFALLLMALAGCSALPLTELPSRADPLPLELPPVKSFAKGPLRGAVVASNLDLARDFLALSFHMESGQTIPKLTRFEGPVTVAFTKEPAALLKADLVQLLERLRTEAGIDIELAKAGDDANILVQTLPRRKLQLTVPRAACFVVPRVRNWKEFRAARRSGALDWTTLKKRERAVVFIPDDVSPQEARDCLHEEIAQSLGPLNDIYRLANSIFNDDNLNTVLTSFDMLMLKVYYSDDLKNGMTAGAVGAKLPGILKKLHPEGEKTNRDGVVPSGRDWIETIETALGPGPSRGKRLLNAQKAVMMARDAKWHDNRLGFSLFALGRLALGDSPEIAIDSFARSYDLYRDLYGTDDVHTAHVALQLAAFALSKGDTNAALDYINDSLPSINRGQNAALLATFLMIKAEALDALGRHSQAATVRLDGLGWARYGLGPEKVIRARLREISALRPRQSETGA